jgi:hypothetical protein
VEDVGAMLRLELETLWVTDERARLLRARTVDWRPAPLLAVASGTDAMVWAASATIADDVAGQINEVLAAEEPPPVQPGVGWRPSTAGILLELLGRQGAVGPIERGPSFVLVDPPDLHEGIECWTSSDVDISGLAGLMPDDDRGGLVAPWAVAMVDGVVAAVCETARSTPASVEAGVWTYEAYRRRGLGAAVTAAWTRLAAERTVFYSTSFDNEASQRIAGRLALRPLAQWWLVESLLPATR